MRLTSKPRSPEEQARAIESKRKLLAYLQSKPQGLSIESFLCLAGILSRAGWRYDQQSWVCGSHRLSAVEAGIVELERQIAADREQLLRQTVGNYDLESRREPQSQVSPSF